MRRHIAGKLVMLIIIVELGACILVLTRLLHGDHRFSGEGFPHQTANTGIVRDCAPRRCPARLQVQQPHVSTSLAASTYLAASTSGLPAAVCAQMQSAKGTNPRSVAMAPRVRRLGRYGAYRSSSSAFVAQTQDLLAEGGAEFALLVDFPQHGRAATIEIDEVTATLFDVPDRHLRPGRRWLPYDRRAMKGTVEPSAKSRVTAATPGRGSASSLAMSGVGSKGCVGLGIFSRHRPGTDRPALYACLALITCAGGGVPTHLFVVG